MSADGAGKPRNVESLDADDRARHARFLAVDAEDAFDWPDNKELSRKTSKSDVKRRRKLRNERNDRRIAALEAELLPTAASTSVAASTEAAPVRSQAISQLVSRAIANVWPSLQAEAASACQARVESAGARVEERLAALRAASSHAEASLTILDLAKIQRTAEDHCATFAQIRAATVATRAAEAVSSLDDVVLDEQLQRRATAQLRDARQEAAQQLLPPWANGSMDSAVKWGWCNGSFTIRGKRFGLYGVPGGCCLSSLDGSYRVKRGATAPDPCQTCVRLASLLRDLSGESQIAPLNGPKLERVCQCCPKHYERMQQLIRESQDPWMFSHGCCNCLPPHGESSPQRPWEEVCSFERELRQPLRKRELEWAAEREAEAKRQQREEAQARRLCNTQEDSDSSYDEETNRAGLESDEDPVCDGCYKYAGAAYDLAPEITGRKGIWASTYEQELNMREECLPDTHSDVQLRKCPLCHTPTKTIVNNGLLRMILKRKLRAQRGW